MSGTAFKFVTSDGIGSTQKRQQAQRACERCRKRKKRCHHTATSQCSSPTSAGVQSDNHRVNSSHGLSLQSPGISTRPSRRHIPEPSVTSCEGVDSGSNVVTRSQRPPPLGHFQDILSRENWPKHVESPRSVAHQEGQSSRFIGDLSPEGLFLAATSPETTADNSIGTYLSSSSTRTAFQGLTSSQTASNLFRGSGSLVQKVLLPMLEHECISMVPTPARMEALSRIYFEKVHPIFPVIDEEAYNILDATDPGKVLLQQGICLAASKNFNAREYLVLPESQQALPCRTFGERLSSAMRMSIEMGLVSNKILIIQALALMSQFMDNPAGEDITSQLCGRAIDHAHSLGLQIKVQQRDEIDESSTTLFCCVWAIDRMNAALNGRPVLMHERDTSKDLNSCFERQAPCFRVFLRVIGLLDRVIELYRPSTNFEEGPVLDWEFPTFEDVVVDCGGAHIGMSALATIETFYHAVAILSCRSKTWRDPHHTSISYLRQSLSTSIIGTTICHELQEQVVMFPFVPYALSLSLVMAYRGMRNSKLPFHRARSRTQFQTICDALSEMEGVFWFAATISEMGKKLLKEMDRVFSAAVSERRPQQQTSNQNISNLPSSNEATLNSDTHETNTQQVHNSLGQDIQNNTIQEFDPSLFNSAGDIDLFGMFDPAFDLDHFDACLEANLNPAFPTNFQ